MTDRNSEHGASLVEYALIVALSAIVAIAALNTLGDNVAEQFCGVSETKVDGAAAYVWDAELKKCVPVSDFGF